MKLKLFVSFLLGAGLAGAGVWWALHWARPARPQEVGAPAVQGQGRKILYYQSAMHPWIKSDKPGKCTICGMDLAPVYEGEKGFDLGPGLVSLNPNSITVLHVQTAPVRRQPLRRTLRVAGVVESSEERYRVLSAYVAGRIDRLFVNYVGAEVVEGQPLATFYSPTLLNAEREFVSLTRPIQGAADAGVATSREQLRAAAALRLRQLGLTEAQIQALPAKPEDAIHSEILAPLSGTILSRQVFEGQYVQEGERLFEIADLSTVWFKFDVYERDLAWIKVGDPVEMTTPAEPGKVYRGRISFIDPNIMDMSRSAKVRMEVANPLVEEGGLRRRELFHRLYAEGIVEVGIPEALAVPRSAVLAPGPRPVVYIDRGSGTYEQRQVKLGRAGDDLWEILEGLQEGESVVTSGNFLLDGQAQLNQVVQEATSHAKPGHPTHSPQAADLALSETQQGALRDLFSLANTLGRSLAADNLEQFNQEIQRASSVLARVRELFRDQDPWVSRLGPLEAVGPLAKAPGLAEARQSFLPLSMAVVEWAKAVRAQESFAGLKIYRCPMVDRAVSGANKDGYWVQEQGPLRNPFFGAKMLECGVEVK